MSKVTIIRNNNPHFPEAVSDYLEANGYRRMDGKSGLIHFHKGDKAVMVNNDAVDFMVHHDEEEGQRKMGYSRYMAVSGISQMDIFKWQMQLHIADIVPFKTMLRRVEQEFPGEVKKFVMQTFGHFKVTDDHNAVPECY